MGDHDLDTHDLIRCLQDFLRALGDQDAELVIRALRITADRIEADEREARARDAKL